MASTRTIKCILAIYSWVAIEVLIAFLWRIAYFYERTSSQRTGYYFLSLPALLLAAGAIWYLVRSVEFTGQPIGDLLLFGGGVLLGICAIRLQELMTGEKKR